MNIVLIGMMGAGKTTIGEKLSKATGMLLVDTDQKIVEKHGKISDIFEKYGVLTRAEIASRRDILLENYSKTVHIEAKTMLDMARKMILPTAVSYSKEMCDAIAAKRAVGLDARVEEAIAAEINDLTACLYDSVNDLMLQTGKMAQLSGALETAEFCRKTIVPAMERLRTPADALELLVPADQWPFPSYSDILYNI